MYMFHFITLFLVSYSTIFGYIGYILRLDNTI